MTSKDLELLLDACFIAKKITETLPALPKGIKPRHIHVLTAVPGLAAPGIAQLLQVPAEAAAKTIQYLRICSGGILVIIAYNVISSGAAQHFAVRRAHRPAGDNGADLFSGHQFHRQQHGADAQRGVRRGAKNRLLHHAGAQRRDAKRLGLCGAKCGRGQKGPRQEGLFHRRFGRQRGGRGDVFAGLLRRRAALLGLHRRCCRASSRRCAFVFRSRC